MPVSPSVRAALLTTCLLSGLAILMTWPLLPNLDRAVTDPGDPYLVTFILDWVAARIAAGSLDVFDAPILHPAAQSLAFTEHLIGLGMLALPLRALGIAPLATYNILFLLGFVVSGLAAWLLAWHLSRSRTAAMAAAIFYAFVPYRMGQATHLQHVWSAFLPLALWALLRLRERPTWGRAAVFSLSVTLLGLTNVHWLLFGSVALCISAIVLAAGGTQQPRFAGVFAASFSLAILLLLPTLLPYRSVSREYGAARQESEVKAYSASATDWLVPAAYQRTYDTPRPDHEPERRLFPGVILLAGTAAGLVAARRTAAFPVLIAWLILGWVGSLGVHSPFHRWLFEYFEPFRAIRVPARWSMIAYTAMAILAALALARLTRRCRRGCANAIAAIVCILFLYEVHTFPMRWYCRGNDEAEVYRWIRSLPSDVATLELPIQSRASEYEYTLAATTHHHPIVNGAAGFVPPFQRQVIESAHSNPVPDRLLEQLQEARVRLIVVHADRLGEREAATIEFLRRNLVNGRLALINRFPHEQRDDYVFLIKGTSPEELDMHLRPASEQTLLFEDLAAGRYVASLRTSGVLDFPPPGFKAAGGLLVSGWAASPHGIREVRVRFNNGRVEIPADLVPRPDLRAVYPHTPSTGFHLELASRPAQIRPEADLQVRIVDGSGGLIDLEQIWFELSEP